MERLIPGLLMAVLWILLLFLPPLIFWCVIVIGAAIAVHELFTLLRRGAAPDLLQFLIPLCLLPVLLSITGSAALVLIGVYLALLSLVAAIIFLYSRCADPLADLLHTGFAVVYISVGCAFLVLLHFRENGSFWLLLLTAVTAGSDTGAYYVGRAIGRRKLCPNISPGKTINGALGGIFTAVLAAVILGCFLLPQVSSIRLALAAVLLAPVGIAGDLAESIIKRGTGIKDSGTLLAGHGGLLDRTDSLLFAGPLLYLLLYSGVLR